MPNEKLSREQIEKRLADIFNIKMGLSLAAAFGVPVDKDALAELARDEEGLRAQLRELVS